MILKTKRLLISEIKEGDASFYFELFNDKDWIRFISNKNLISVAETKTYIKDVLIPTYTKNGLGFFTVFLSKTNTPIGTATLIQRDNLGFIDVGYGYLPKGRKKGYATEATKRLMLYLKEDLQQKKVGALTKPDNKKSIKLLENLGFKFIKSDFIFNKKHKDNLYTYSF